MRAAVLAAALLAAACADEEASRQAEARALVARLSEPQAFARAVGLREVKPLVEATAEANPEETRCLACLALGRIGGAEARARLEELAAAGGRVGRCARAGLSGLSPEELRARDAREAEATDRPSAG